MNQKKQQLYLKILLIFVIIQPIFDVMSRMAILGYIPNISTYIKPLFVFSLTAILLFKYSPFKRKWIIYLIVFSLFILGHSILLYKLLVGKSIILHEIRFIINILYMVCLFVSFFTIYHWYENKEEMFKKIKYTLVYTFAGYLILYFISIITGTSDLTYEYADKYKKGFKGWFDSGQILGHAFSISFPIILYVILKPSRFKIIRAIYLILSAIFVSLLGTKVPYYIFIIVLIAYILLIIFFKFYKKEKLNIFNLSLVIILIIGMVSTYKYTPVYANTNINKANAQVELDKYNLSQVSGKQKKYEDIVKENPGADISYLKKYYNWGEEASNFLQTQFKKGKIHPSDTRSKQFAYSLYKFNASDIQYKLLGIGFLNQESSLALERDFYMAIFNFGIIGFILFLAIPILTFIKTIKFVIKNFKKIDLEFCMLFMGIGIFFSISMYAGYTYIYTNFSIFLATLLTLLLLKMNILSKERIKDIKDIKFLNLHLGFGGVETATINSANALCDKYNVEIISFYNLEKNQANKLNPKIKVKYLYNSGPNKNEFINALKHFKIIKTFKEGFKAIKILHLKKSLIKKEIINTNKGAIVSTRVEFSQLLSKYGKENVLKIAQEHLYHNKNKKYIRKLKEDYLNIDYLCALTTTLKEDYKKFLKYNPKTKIILMPNMLSEYPKEKSSLKIPNVISVSRLDYGKRNDEIIKMFNKIKNKKSCLYIIGDGKEKNNLENQIKELKLNKTVEMTGYLSHDEIKKYMLNSSVFVMASVSEGLPMVLLEAMSYGLPCVVYETPSGTKDIVTNGYNGYIIKNRNEKQFINALNELTNNFGTRKKMGENAIKTAQNFSKENILKIWEKMLTNHA